MYGVERCSASRELERGHGRPAPNGTLPPPSLQPARPLATAAVPGVCGWPGVRRREDPGASEEGDHVARGAPRSPLMLNWRRSRSRCGIVQLLFAVLGC